MKETHLPPSYPELGRRQRKKLRTRQALLDAGAALFSARGLYLTRVEDITERADLAKAAFYNYFESKEDLIAELVEMAVLRLAEGLAARPDRGGTLRERLETLALAHEQFFDAEPGVVVLFHQARGLQKVEATASERVQQSLRRYLELVAAEINQVLSGLRRTARAGLDVAASFVGALAGRRSFCVALGLAVDSAGSARLVAAAFAEQLSAQPRAAAARHSAGGPGKPRSEKAR